MKKEGRPVNTAPFNKEEPVFGVVLGLIVPKIDASIPASDHLERIALLSKNQSSAALSLILSAVSVYIPLEKAPVPAPIRKPLGAFG